MAKKVRKKKSAAVVVLTIIAVLLVLLMAVMIGAIVYRWAMENGNLRMPVEMAVSTLSGI